MIEAIRSEADERGITRLCHFTPSRNLAQIATGKTGILATKNLERDERSVYTPTDLERLDGFTSHICCSIEYPNAWYFDQARAKEPLFRDWVVLLIAPHYLWEPGTLFCPRNASAGQGRYVGSGEEAFRSLYAESTSGAGDRTFVRSSRHLRCCPTDEQAEVLVPDQIALRAVLAVAVASEQQAKNERARFRLMGVDERAFKFVIATAFFDKYRLSACIRTGSRPTEEPWTGSGG